MSFELKGGNTLILISACLVGFDVKYDGSNNFNEIISEWFATKKAIPVCPEVLGGLSTQEIPLKWSVEMEMMYLMGRQR